MGSGVFYHEQARFDGEWISVKCNGRPETKKINGVLRLKNSDGLGPRLRFEPIEVARGHADLSLDQLRQCYSPDGKFRAATRTPEETDNDQD
ncbi:hypothetical protein GCM10011360_17930 [Primorskyibacter flagellatus]|uniref:Uncharacterized protein n=1 Tax=Primorskyibacter flagellatus TaxID=1387277 RepID=A0A917A7F4_9RHOB|nr:hypothetical protein [Primorskyibacter flagellatus]GGE30317.1 hypothetical protein GCM10011360_17930 [Primorskyibacter flagellatus]